MIKDKETAAVSLSPNYKKQASLSQGKRSVTGTQVAGEAGAALCLGEWSGGHTAHLRRSFGKPILSHLGKHKEGSILAELH